MLNPQGTLMVGWLFRLVTVLSGLALLTIGPLWPRSYFIADKWWVKNNKPIPPAKSPWTTGWDPDRWTEGSAWLSDGGNLRLYHYDYLLAPGELRSEPKMRAQLEKGLFLPRLDPPFGMIIPYWCLASVAGICPAIWLSRRSDFFGMPMATRFGVRHLLHAMTLIALGLTGYIQLGMGGAVLALEFASTIIATVALTKRACREGGRRRYSYLSLSIGLLCCSLGLLYFYVDCYQKFVVS